VIYHTPRHIKPAKIGGSQTLQKYSFMISLASPQYSKGKDRCGGVWRAKLFCKIDFRPKHPSIRSTNEMTVKFWLFG